VYLTGRKWQKDQEKYNAEHCTTYTLQTAPKWRGIKWTGHVVGIRAEKCIKNLDQKHWRKMSLWQAAHKWEGNIKMHKKTYSGKGDPLFIGFITGSTGGLNTISHWTFYFRNRWKLFITGTANIHCSKTIPLLDVGLKMWNMSKRTPNTMPNHDKNALVLCFQSCGFYYTRKNGSCAVLDRGPMFCRYISAPDTKGQWRQRKSLILSVGLMSRLSIACWQFLMSLDTENTRSDKTALFKKHKG
jgi:hypothetical protein